MTDIAQHSDSDFKLRDLLSLEIFSNKMDSKKLELLTWDFPVSLAIAKSGTLAPRLTQCLWNPLLHAFHRSLQLVVFSTWCQASVDFAWVESEPLLFDWVLYF